MYVCLCVCVCVCASVCVWLAACEGSSDKPSTLRCHWTYPLMRSPRQVLPCLTPSSLSLYLSFSFPLSYTHKHTHIHADKGPCGESELGARPSDLWPALFQLYSSLSLLSMEDMTAGEDGVLCVYVSVCACVSVCVCVFNETVCYYRKFKSVYLCLQRMLCVLVSMTVCLFAFSTFAHWNLGAWAYLDITDKDPFPHYKVSLSV